MIELEKEFVSGDGGFSADPLTYKQIQRTGKFAIYERSRDGKVRDFEVIIIRTDPKGKVQKFPGGVIKTLEDDVECYPSSGQWGKKAWSFRNKGGAIAKFDALIAEGVKEEAEEDEEETGSVKEITIPEGVEFSTTEFGELVHISYPEAAAFIRDALTAHTIKFIREEHRSARGKATRIYAKA